jgi:mono/diheme cytochrome c family protein
VIACRRDPIDEVNLLDFRHRSVCVLLAIAALVFVGGRPAAGQGDGGKEEFARAGCATCHGPAAQGADAPALAGTSRSYADFVRIVREGTGEMSPHSKDQVSDEQLAVIHTWLVRLSPKDSRGLRHRRRLG